MSREVFQKKIYALLAKSNSTVSVKFIHEGETHVAKFSDGTSIIGNSLIPEKVLVKWGSGHRAMATI